jgi:cyclopropane-fatty-acyl-phospholipid synthase
LEATVDRLLKLFLSRIIDTGALTVVTASGCILSFGDGSGVPVTVRFTSRTWQLAVMLDPGLRLGEAYMHGGLIIERGSAADLLDLIVQNLGRRRDRPWVRALKNGRDAAKRFIHDNNLRRARVNARHHYDIDRRIYDLFLDSNSQYSCAYFEHDDASLDEAQQAKMRHIAAKLLLNDPRLLDIGSGWGGLDLYLARQLREQAYGNFMDRLEAHDGAAPHVVGINLSPEQIKFSRQRASAEGADCEFLEQDYRRMTGKFDRIVSVGMFEHVGKRHHGEFFQKCFDLLAPDGVMLLHTVGRLDGPSKSNAWVERYIFPGGYTPALSEVTPIIERSGFIVSDIEVLRLHYAKTLHLWRERFLGQRDQAAKLRDEKFVKMWDWYLAGFEASFKYYGLVVFQIQLIKTIDAAPITRDYLYAKTPNVPYEAQIAAE